MTPAKKAFRWTFLIFLGLGILMGLLKQVAPNAVTITINEVEQTGFAALAWSTGFGAGLGIFFGLIVALIVKLATRGTQAR